MFTASIDLNAQSGCGSLGGASTLLTPTVLPYCQTIDIEAVVQNLDVPGEGDDLDAQICISFGSDIEDNVPGIIASLEAIEYVGTYPLYAEDTWASQDGNNFYRRFCFAVSDLPPGNTSDWTEIFKFSVEPNTYAVDPTIEVIVEYSYQDVSTCGNYVLETIDSHVDVYNNLTDPPISGNVSNLIGLGLLLNNSQTNSIIEQKIIQGNLIVDENYWFDGPGGVNGRPQLYLSPGSKIVVLSERTLTLVNADIFTCDHLAEGIEVQTGGRLSATTSNIDDCRYGINAKYNAALTLNGNTFSDNFVGINLDMSAASPGSRRVIIKAMNGNTFQTQNGLKTPYTGMPEDVESRGYCGIQLKSYEHFNVGGNQSFLSLANGIIGINSTGNINNMAFDDMHSVDQSPVYLLEGYGINLKSKGGSHWFNINQTYTTMTFNDCKTGVFADSYAGRVAGTEMTNVNAGIEWLHSNNRDMAFRYNDITAHHFGIRTFLNEPVHSISIMENNTVTVTDALTGGNDPVGAIVMEEIGLGTDPNGPITPTFTAAGWTVKGNDLTLEQGGNGILYRNGINGLLFANTVMNESEPDNYKGILTQGSYFISVSNNTVSQESTTGLGTAFGIYSAGGQGNTFQCNCIDYTNVGMQFFDMADFPNAVRGNNFNKHCTGLQIGFDGVGGSFIGDQVHAGNLWDLSAITGSCLGARHHGGASDISKSEFFVNGNTNPALNPSVFPTTDWFYNEPGSTFSGCSSCSFPTTIPTRLTESNTPTAFDFEVADGNYTTDAYTNEMLWKARYRLYRKLLRRSAVESYDSVFAAFKSGYQNTSFAKLADIAEQKAQLFNLTEAQDSILENLRMACRFYDNDLRLLDSLVQTGATVSETTYNNTKGFAASALGSYETYAGTLRTVREQKIHTLDSLNTLVSTVLTPDANHKAVNAIVFDFLLTDSIAAADMTALEAIAAQCPLEGGDAVYEARAIVGYFTGAQYDDEGACLVQPRDYEQRNAVNAHDFINVYPNPTTGDLRWEGMDGVVAIIRVYNRLGQLQMQQPAINPRIDLTGMPDGLYWVQFLDAESKILAVKSVNLTRN